MEGRRVAKSLAVPSPKIVEIEAAAAKLGLEREMILDKGHPRAPWHKVGMLLVEKRGSKERVISGIAKQLQKARNEAPRSP